MTETRLYGSDKQFPVFHDVCNRNRDRESLAPPPAPPLTICIFIEREELFGWSITDIELYRMFGVLIIESKVTRI